MKNKRFNKKFCRKSMALFAVFSLLFTANAFPSYAASSGSVSTLDVDVNQSDELTLSTSVGYSKGGNFTVTIPKTISLDGTKDNPTQAFSVKVKGDMPGYASLHVSSDETFLMKQAGKEDVTARVAYSHDFPGTDITEEGISDEGEVSIPDTNGNKLSAGNWAGQFNFYINCQEGTIPVSGITINSPSSTTVSIGQTLQLTAEILPYDAEDTSVSWRSSNDSIARVNSLGKVTALAEGTATITATAKDGSGVSDSIDITVAYFHMQSIELHTESSYDYEQYVQADTPITIYADIDPANATDPRLEWEPYCYSGNADVRMDTNVTGKEITITPLFGTYDPTNPKRNYITFRAYAKEDRTIYGEILLYQAAP